MTTVPTPEFVLDLLSSDGQPRPGDENLTGLADALRILDRDLQMDVAAGLYTYAVERIFVAAEAEQRAKLIPPEEFRDRNLVTAERIARLWRERLMAVEVVGWASQTLPGIDDLIRQPERVEGETLTERFLRFHELNPHVYQALRRLALDLARNGRSRIGIGMLFEVMRWQRLVATTGEEWLLNNDYRAPYARLLMASEPELAGIFETRRSKADGHDFEGEANR